MREVDCGPVRNVRDQVDSENRGAQYLKSEILVCLCSCAKTELENT